MASGAGLQPSCTSRTWALRHRRQVASQRVALGHGAGSRIAEVDSGAVQP